MYEVVIHAKAEKEYKKLPERIKRAFAKAMLILQTNPYPFREYDLKKLRGSENIFRIRVGDYRLVYSVEKNLKRIAVLKIEHRKRAY